MSEIVISTVYVSAVDQQISGRVYMAGEVVPDAHTIPTLAALLKTNRIREHSQAAPMVGFEEAPEDLGIDEARPPRPKKKKTRARKRTKRTRKGATAVK